MKIKPGVNLNGLKTPMIWALWIIDAVFAEYAIETTITSGLDGEHMKGSLHYRGLALDFRTRGIYKPILEQIYRTIKPRLGKTYDVVLEKTHLHVEYDPKGK